MGTCGYLCTKKYEDINTLQLTVVEYRFKVGKRNLHIKNYLSNLGDISANIISKATKGGLAHHCLLYGEEIFELDQNGYHRRNYIYCDDYKEYVWSKDKKGISSITPDELDNHIRNKGNLKYDAITNNCQHFVAFCLTFINEELAIKYKNEEMCCGPCIGPNIPQIRRKKIVSMDIEDHTFMRYNSFI